MFVFALGAALAGSLGRAAQLTQLTG
jgi:hypothetical protein